MTGEKREIKVKVLVTFPDGTERVEIATSDHSRRHAVLDARHRYAGQARVMPAEPGIL